MGLSGELQLGQKRKFNMNHFVEETIWPIRKVYPDIIIPMAQNDKWRKGLKSAILYVVLSLETL